MTTIIISSFPVVKININPHPNILPCRVSRSNRLYAALPPDTGKLKYPTKLRMKPQPVDFVYVAVAIIVPKFRPCSKHFQFWFQLEIIRIKCELYSHPKIPNSKSLIIFQCFIRPDDETCKCERFESFLLGLSFNPLNGPLPCATTVKD